MVDLESPSLVALANSTAPLTHQRNLSEWTQVTLLQASLITVGWISRKPLPSGRGRSFFLTSLLIELIEEFSGMASGPERDLLSTRDKYQLPEAVLLLGLAPSSPDLHKRLPS